MSDEEKQQDQRDDEKTKLLLTRLSTSEASIRYKSPLTWSEILYYGLFFTLVMPLLWFVPVFCGAYLRTYPALPWFEGMWIYTAVLAVSHLVSFLILIDCPEIHREIMELTKDGLTVVNIDNEQRARIFLFVYCFFSIVFSSYEAAGWKEPFPNDRYYMGSSLVFTSFILFSWVFRSNKSASVVFSDEKRKSKTLVEDGPYSFVRHPFYSFLLPFFCGIPLLIGSYKGLAALLPAYFVCACLTPHIEASMIEKYGDEYRRYQISVPFKTVPGIF